MSVLVSAVEMMENSMKTTILVLALILGRFYLIDGLCCAVWEEQVNRTDESIDISILENRH